MLKAHWKKYKMLRTAKQCRQRYRNSKNQKEMVEIKSCVIVLKNTLIPTPEESISELQYVSVETSQTEIQRQKEQEKKETEEMSKSYRTITKSNTYRAKKSKGSEKIF